MAMCRQDRLHKDCTIKYPSNGSWFDPPHVVLFVNDSWFCLHFLCIAILMCCIAMSSVTINDSMKEVTFVVERSLPFGIRLQQFLAGAFPTGWALPFPIAVAIHWLDSQIKDFYSLTEFTKFNSIAWMDGRNLVSICGVRWINVD